MISMCVLCTSEDTKTIPRCYKEMSMRIIFRKILLVGIAFMITGLCACGITEKSVSLEESVIGQWHGQVDIAKMIYKELGDELGIELSPEPAYCDIYFVFDEDGTYLLKIDSESFAKAVGECAEPYTSAIFGFDTGSLVDIIMQYVAKDMPVDTGEERGTYEVNEDELSVLMSTDDGDEITLVLDNEGHLQYEDEEINQTVILEKQ